jgi:ribosomal protein S18 acetylase RimI-like enzyme
MKEALIQYSESKVFSAGDLDSLFRSVGWISANYPERLAAAMGNSSTVYSAWDGDRLIGLINALDDGALTAYVHYLLVRPEYQGRGIGKTLVRKMKEKYDGYLYLLLVAEEADKIGYYEKLGFQVVKGATPLYIMNTDANMQGK